LLLLPLQAVKLMTANSMGNMISLFCDIVISFLIKLLE